MKALQQIRRTAMHALLPEDYFVIELDKFMRDLREFVNKTRIAGNEQWVRGALSYHVGRVHGLWYGMGSQLIFTRGHGIYEHCAELAQAAHNEASFLTEAYLRQEAA